MRKQLTNFLEYSKGSINVQQMIVTQLFPRSRFLSWTGYDWANGISGASWLRNTDRPIRQTLAFIPPLTLLSTCLKNSVTLLCKTLLLFLSLKRILVLPFRIKCQCSKIKSLVLQLLPDPSLLGIYPFFWFQVPVLSTLFQSLHLQSSIHIGSKQLCLCRAAFEFWLCK